MNERIMSAAKEYKDRQSRRTHPAGEFDKGGRWYPSENERQSCCDSIRSPSRAWPMSYNRHCRSAQHVAALYGVDPADLRRAARAM